MLTTARFDLLQDRRVTLQTLRYRESHMGVEREREEDL